MKFDMREFFENLSRKFKFVSNVKRRTGVVHEDLCTFVIISRSVLLTMRNILDKFCRENQNTCFMFNKFPPPPKKKNLAVYEIMWKSVV